MCHAQKVLARFSSFFVASGGASAAFIGLLFVALAIENQSPLDEGRRARRRALSSSSFIHLLDVFVFSLIGLAGQIEVFADVSIAMALLCLVNISQVLPRVIRTGSWSEPAAWRKPAILLPSTSITLFLLQVVFALLVSLHPQSEICVRLTLFSTVGIFVGALARAWLLPQT